MPSLEYGFIFAWYLVIMAAILCYAMLDGFDLGVGSLHLYTKQDEERRIFLNAIGPVWDGNEVWLIIVIGGLFAGFPVAYATLLSAFYIPITCLIFALIFRAVAIEFRSKLLAPWWRATWDSCFSLGSIAIAVGLGMIIGNLVEGIPLDKEQHYVGATLTVFVRPYPLFIGLLTLTVLQMHGALYLLLKTREVLQEKIRRWLPSLIGLFVLMYVVATLETYFFHPYMLDRIRAHPALLFLVLVNLLAIGGVARSVRRKQFGIAFLCSCLNITCLLSLFAIGTFPLLIRSSIDPAYSLSVVQAASSLKTLMILMVIVGIGLPLVLCYGFFIYRLFRGPVEIDKTSY